MNGSGSVKELDLFAALGQFIVKQFLDTFQEFTPRIKPASFIVDDIMAKMEAGFGSH